MAKAFLKGVLWGSALSVSLVGIVSVIGNASKPELISTEADPVDAAPAAETAGAPASAAQPQTAAKAPMSSAPAPDTLSAVPQDATQSAAVPEVGAVDAMAATTDAPDTASVGTATTAQKTPVVPGLAAPALVTPSSDPEVSVSTDPGIMPDPQAGPQVALALDPEQPPTPEVDGQGQAFAPVNPVVNQAVPEPSISVDPTQPPVPKVVGQVTAFGSSAPDPGASNEPENMADEPDPVATEAAVGVAEAQTDLSDAPVVAQVEAPETLGPVAEPVLQEPVLPEARTEGKPRELAPAVDPEALRPAQSETGLSPAVSDNPQPPTPVPATPVPPEAAGLEVVEASPDAGLGPQDPAAAPETSTPRAPLAPQQAEETQVPTDTLPEARQSAAAIPPARPSILQGNGGGIPGRPAGTLGNLAGEVRTNRLPTLADPGETVEAAEVLPDVIEGPGDDSVRPIDQYAEAVENPDGKPMMAIVLMDAGVDLSAQTIGLPALRSFPYPVSFAVNALLPDATARMEAYRAEGFEVLAMVDLPEGASARDAEVTLEVALAAVPEAVGLLDGVLTGVQPTRAAADQVTGILAQTGHGFVSQNRGLNTTQKLAAREGVPSAVVFRDFDSAGQTPTVIRRFLDQGAFRAGQEGAVIMLGRLREDTISALLLWALQDRAAQVAMVPVSGVLTTEE